MADDADIATTLFALLDGRAATSSICPSEVARALATDEAAWRELMPQVRRVAADLARQGALRVTARGAEVDALSTRGPIRLAQPRSD